MGLMVIECGPQKGVLVKRLLNGNCGQRGAVLLSLQDSGVHCLSAWNVKGFSSAARYFSASSLPSLVIIAELCPIVCGATNGLNPYNMMQQLPSEEASS